MAIITIPIAPAANPETSGAPGARPAPGPDNTPASPVTSPILSATGATFLLGKTSYSGADIKAVIHVYDSQVATAQDLKALDDQISALKQEIASDLNDIQSEITLKKEGLKELEAQRAKASTNGPSFSTRVLADIQTLSLSSHREVNPVRSLGSVYPRSHTRGPRTIGGSMVFTVFDQGVLADLITSLEQGDPTRPTSSVLIDQLPPFDITIVFANEYGQMSRMAIYGVRLINEGTTMSVQDLMMENVVQYVARDFDPLQKAGTFLDTQGRLTETATGVTASSLLLDQGYQKEKYDSNPFLRTLVRNDPFR